MKDDQILALISSHQQEGLSCLLDKYGGLMAYIIRNTGLIQEEDLAECLSDVLYTLWKRIGKYDKSKASFKTWIMLVTRGCALDYLRKNKKNCNIVSLEDVKDLPAVSMSDGLCDGSVIDFRHN